MKKGISLLIIGLLCLFMFSILAPKTVAPSEPLIMAWDKTYGGTAQDYANSVKQTSDGGYIVAGTTQPSGEHSRDFWLVKTDADGNQQWNKTYGGTTEDKARSVIQTSDGGYAVLGTTYIGYANLDFWLVKTDANGNEQWNKKYGGTREEVRPSIVQTSDGGYALAGLTYSFSVGGGCGFWLVKIDSAGNQLWAKTYQRGTNDDGLDIIQTADGGYALAGETGGPSAESKDAWLVKTDSSGNLQWDKTYGGPNYDYVLSLVQIPDEGYVLAGGTHSFGAGNCDFWLVKTNSEGNQQWAQTYGGANWDGMDPARAHSVLQTVDEGYLIAGTTESFGAGGKDGWVVKTDSSGNMQWNSTYGGTGDDELLSLEKTSDGGFVLAGATNSFGVGDYDFWLIKLAPPKIPATIDIDPDTLNLKSNGEFVTAYIELPEGYNVADIDLSTVQLEGIPAITDPQYGFVTDPASYLTDHDEDGILERMVKFDRATVRDALTDVIDYEEGVKFYELTLAVTGELLDGILFEGTDTITVIKK